MEHIPESTAASGVVADPSKACGWNVPNQHLGTARRLATDVLRNIANCNVYWISGLPSKESKLCLVRGNYQWNNCSTGLASFKGCLSQHSKHSELFKSPERTCTDHHQSPVYI